MNLFFAFDVDSDLIINTDCSTYKHAHAIKIDERSQQVNMLPLPMMLMMIIMYLYCTAKHTHIDISQRQQVWAHILWRSHYSSKYTVRTHCVHCAIYLFSGDSFGWELLEGDGGGAHSPTFDRPFRRMITATWFRYAYTFTSHRQTFTHFEEISSERAHMNNWIIGFCRIRRWNAYGAHGLHSWYILGQWSRQRHTQ